MTLEAPVGGGAKIPVLTQQNTISVLGDASQKTQTITIKQVPTTKQTAVPGFSPA